MAISKRRRYQVLQRDKYTCRYCGARPPGVVLVVDHVVPIKHGGWDELSNLATACDDCNSGKSALMPDSWLVKEIQDATAEWVPPAHLEDGYEPSDEELAELEREWAITEGCFKLLASCTAHEVLYCISQAYIEARPYRPTNDELTRAAAAIAMRDITQPSTV